MGVIKKWWVFGTTLLLLFVYQNCAPLEAIQDGSNSGFSSGESADFPTVKAIFDANCVTCHSQPTAQNQNVGLATYQMIMDSNVILGGNALNSQLYQAVESGRMPSGMPALDPLELEAIRTWIDSGAPNDNGDLSNRPPQLTMPQDQVVQLPANSVDLIAVTSDPDGAVLRTVWSQVSGPNMAGFSGDRTPLLTVTNLQTGVYTFQLLIEDDMGAIVTGSVSLTTLAAPVTTVSFQNDIVPILGSSAGSPGACFNCHNNNQMGGTLNVQSFSSIKSLIPNTVPGNTRFYQRLADDSMPQGGPPLSDADKATIRTWITEGATNN